MITVGSTYYEAWGRFFEQRTSGDVVVDHGNETATVERSCRSTPTSTTPSRRPRPAASTRTPDRRPTPTTSACSSRRPTT
ncbi:hypothetical protein ACFQRB_10355 [Halobaculum litoreum]|uniref:Uncharacterized protein n=1 Tax=Halobaculum litoreum TaxID=3031998 RepID=A0ABD5XNX9_9EURY